MTKFLRSTLLAALFAPLLVVHAHAQHRPLDLEPSLLLATAPTLGALRFDATGACDPFWRPRPLDAYVDLSPIHQRMLLTNLADPADARAPHACWLTLPTPTAAALFNAAIQGSGDFQPVERWSSTATQGGGLGQGDPTTLRYSFVPDGTFIPNGVGEGSAPSNLFSQFNAVFPSQATWQNRIRDAFLRWGELTGVNYVLEPNDDGAAMFGAAGVVGVRGDVRIGGKFVDGPNNLLAYNLFPSGGGDMVFDSSDLGNYANPSANYLLLFNVAAHEHGHGLGIDHVCPLNDTKLMEPLATLAFSGPQYDDILTGQRLYGDPLEHNDTIATATNLGILGNGITNVTNVSIDDNSDGDNYRIEIQSDKLLDITVIPTGIPYLEGPEVGNCSGGALLDPRIRKNLSMTVLNGTGTQLIAFANSQPAGGNESLANLSLTTGTYHIRVAGDAIDTIQTYRLEINVVDNGIVAAAIPFGTGCGGLGWTALNRPLVGSTQINRFQNIPNPASSIGLVLLGYGEIPGGINLTPVGAPGCIAWVDTLDIAVIFPVTSASQLWLLSIPNTPSLSGTSIFTQGAIRVPPGTNALGVLTANAIELLIGTQ